MAPRHWPGGRYDTPDAHWAGPLHATQAFSTVSVVVVPSHCRLLPWYEPLGQLTAHGAHCRSAATAHWLVW